MSESKQKAVAVLVQSIVTALLLFIQSFFFQSCMSAQGDIHKRTDLNISVPSLTASDYSYLSQDYPVLYKAISDACEVNPLNVDMFDSLLVPAYNSGVPEDVLLGYIRDNDIVLPFRSEGVGYGY